MRINNNATKRHKGKRDCHEPSHWGLSFTTPCYVSGYRKLIRQWYGNAIIVIAIYMVWDFRLITQLLASPDKLVTAVLRGLRVPEPRNRLLISTWPPLTVMPSDHKTAEAMTNTWTMWQCSAVFPCRNCSWIHSSRKIFRYFKLATMTSSLRVFQSRVRRN